MPRRWLIGWMLLATCGGGCARTVNRNSPYAELQGTWEVKQIINNGQPVLEDEIQGMKFVFAGEKLTMTGPGEGPDEVTVRLDPAREPKAMDLTDADGKILAIYKREGRTLTIALPPRTANQRARPTKFEFEQEQESDLSVIILNRS